VVGGVGFGDDAAPVVAAVLPGGAKLFVVMVALLDEVVAAEIAG